MEGQCSETLHEGAMVCLYTKSGELLTVKQKNEKMWELLPMSGTDTHVLSEGTKLKVFPWECIFVVMTSDAIFGFRSLGAGGRSLQAVNDANTPHRCSNFNFGPWESWSPSPQGLVNCKWPSKTLDLDIREMCCVSTDDIRTMERSSVVGNREPSVLKRLWQMLFSSCLCSLI